MANSGGGLIVYGVKEVGGSATERTDLGEVTECYERTLRKVASTGVHAPIFGLGIRRLGEPSARALVVVVPPSRDVPHLIYRQDFFGAPIRKSSDTDWMRERQLEAYYRVRHEERRRGEVALGAIYLDSATPIRRFVPVDATVLADASPEAYHDQVRGCPGRSQPGRSSRPALHKEVGRRQRVTIP